MVDLRKTVFQHELIEADLFGEPCEPVTRVAVAAVVTNGVLRLSAADGTQVERVPVGLRQRVCAVHDAAEGRR